MVTFILNDELVTTGKPEGSSLLDFIRYDMGFTGTKAGCREGDCGACTVLAGTLCNATVTYKSVVSCLMPLGNAHGKHIVTIEGIITRYPSPLQESLIKNSAIQCGFCTPGIVMSVMAESLSGRKTTKESVIASLSGNICRCTGYKSLERAADTIAALLDGKNTFDSVRWLVGRKLLPDYFMNIPERLADIPDHEPASEGHLIKIAGGTDLMVQRPEELAQSAIDTLYDRRDLKGIKTDNGKFITGASVTINEFAGSEVLLKFIPGLTSYAKLIASEPVRNMATIGGNLVNASPIGDMTIMLLALDAELMIDGGDSPRTLPLKDFYLSYKKTALEKNEFVRHIIFDCKPEPALFSFEKVSRRTHLDIASVNSALKVIMKGSIISECHLSAGGVSPVPLFLAKTSIFLKGKEVSAETILQATEIMQEEISPISDVRGSAEYKRLLLRQLLIAHFLKLFPDRLNISIEKL